jgi:Tol biopolymer transport system component
MTPGDSAIQWLVEGEADDVQGQVSPDGRWLAYTSDRSGRQEVYVQALDGTGGRVPISAGGGHSPRWAPGGGMIYYAQASEVPLVAAALATDGGIRVLSRADGLRGVEDLNLTGEVNYDVSPDGREFVFIGSPVGGAAVQAAFTWILNWPEMVRRMQVGR